MNSQQMSHLIIIYKHIINLKHNFYDKLKNVETQHLMNEEKILSNNFHFNTWLCSRDL